MKPLKEFIEDIRREAKREIWPISDQIAAEMRNGLLPPDYETRVLGRVDKPSSLAAEIRNFYATLDEVKRRFESVLIESGMSVDPSWNLYSVYPVWRSALERRILPSPVSREPISAEQWHQENRHKFLTGETVYPYGHSREKIEYLDEVAMLRAYARAATRSGEVVNFVAEPHPGPSCHVCGAIMHANHWTCSSCHATTGVKENWVKSTDQLPDLKLRRVLVRVDLSAESLWHRTFSKCEQIQIVHPAAVRAWPNLVTHWQPLPVFP